MANKDKRESGEPGGGAGRRDEVGGSGVYPFGTNAPKDAKVQPAGSFGQGERGAAGYEDHGSSELTDMGNTVVGGYGEPDVELHKMTGDRREQVQEIPQQNWASFLNSFSHQHENWLANIEIVSGNDRRVQVHNKNVRDLSCDLSEGHQRVYIATGDIRQNLIHEVTDPKRMSFVTTEHGAHVALEIESADGTRTVVIFRAPGNPEELDRRVA